MKKNIYIITLIVFALSFSACSRQDKEIDILKLSQELLDKIDFEDELIEINSKMVENIYDIDYAVSQKVYVASGATSEEVAVFELENEEGADKAFEAVKQRIEIQKEDFKSYNPEEIPKLDNAIIQKTGRYVIACVSNGNQASEIISSYTK